MAVPVPGTEPLVHNPSTVSLSLSSVVKGGFPVYDRNKTGRGCRELERERVERGN